MLESNLAVAVGIASACAAWIALLLSGFNLFTSRQALGLAREQALKKRPLLVLYMQDGYLSRDDEKGSRRYAFLISISNRSENANSIRDVLLHLTYSKEEVLFNVKVPLSREDANKELNSSINIMSAPAKLDPHQTLAGWFFFQVNEGILNGGRVERTIISVIDTYENQVNTEATIIREHRNDIPPLKGAD